MDKQIKTMGERLKALRESRQWSQEDVSRKINVSVSLIGRYERNERIPPPDKIDLLCDLYGVSADYLLGRTDDPAPMPRSPYTGIRISRDYPIPPKGYEDLSPEEREEVDRITREFEDFHIQRILERKRQQKERGGL